jgi:dUTP pyrophosphatase
MRLPIKQVDQKTPLGIVEPKYPGDAGADLVVLADSVVLPHGFTILRHNFAMEVPEGCFGYIYPRSSTITKYRGSLLVVCSPIDSGFRGEIFTMISNLSEEEVFIPKNTRISQLVLVKHATIEKLQLVDELTPSSRNTNGFGSSGE